MQFAVEAWAPEYGSAMGTDEQLAASDAHVDVDVEVPGDQWAPRSPAPSTTAAPCVVFTDGVRRVDAQVWVAGADGTSRPGICASYAAGAVRCNGQAEVAAVEVRRGLFTAAPGAQAIVAKQGPDEGRAVGGGDPHKLSLWLPPRLGGAQGEGAGGPRARRPPLVGGAP